MAKLRQFVVSHKIGIIWTSTTILILIALFTFGVLRFGWGWTGFFAYSTTTITPTGKTIQTHPGKTLWDLLELFIIPVALALGVYWLNEQARIREREAERRRELQRVNVLIHQMGSPNNEIALEGTRELSSLVSFRDEVLVGVDLDGANLREANFRKANLSEAKLNKTILEGANLSGAKYNNDTVWPDGFNPLEAGAKLVS